MGKFTEAIEAEPARANRVGCAVARLRAQLDPEDLTDFDGLLDEISTGVRTAASVVRILNRSGVPFNPDRLTYHTRGDCSCLSRD